MDLDLTPEQDSFIRRAIDSGRFAHPQDALREALDVWVERERLRDDLLVAIDEAKEDLARVDTITFDSAQSLVEDVVGRGMNRLKNATPTQG